MTIVQSPFFQAQPAGQQDFITPGTSSFTVPPDVTLISAVLIGGGGGGSRGSNTTEQSGGGGGGLRWINSLPVVPGEVLTIYVGSGGAAQTVNNTP